MNNCGPASVAEVLAYWGIWRTQGQVQAILRADGNPYGMVPYGVPAYASSLGLRSLLGTGGSEDLVKALLVAGFPVIVNQWVSLADHVGHYRPIEGYDDRQGVFTASDPFLGPGYQIGYGTFSQIWATNSGRFMVLYPAPKEAVVQGVLSAVGWDKASAYRTDLQRLQRRVALHEAPRDGVSQYWQGHAPLAMAWDYLELGEIGAARAALATAQAQRANAVVVGWIAGEVSRAG